MVELTTVEVRKKVRLIIFSRDIIYPSSLSPSFCAYSHFIGRRDCLHTSKITRPSQPISVSIICAVWALAPTKKENYQSLQYDVSSCHSVESVLLHSSTATMKIRRGNRQNDVELQGESWIFSFSFSPCTDCYGQKGPRDRSHSTTNT